MLATRSNDLIEYISRLDPALDRTHSDCNMEEYLKTFDRKYSPCKEGCEPTIFKLQRLSRKQLQYIVKKPENEQIADAIAFSLKGLTNFKSGGPEGQLVTLASKRSDIGEMLTPETLDKIFAPELFVELKTIIMEISGLHPM